MDNFIVPTTVDAMHNWLKDNWSEWSEYAGLYPLFEVPLSCPWQFERNAGEDQILKAIFYPVKAKLPKTVRVLKERCQKIFALLYQGEWYLLYILKVISKHDNVSIKLFGGGKPTATPQLRIEISELGWTIPKELELLYRTHNGFGNIGLPWTVAAWDTVLPDWNLNVLGEYIAKADVVGCDPNDMLEFYPDGAGNGQFFYRSDDKSEDFWTVDWDHETSEISNRDRFWEFVDRKLSKVDAARIERGEV